MKFDIETLRQYKKEGWIYSQVHPTLPLIIWNYSDKTQYEVKWDKITLNCRALVTDTKGNVISKGFTKFFNYSEGKTNIPENIKWVRVYEKLDGSYIGLFYYAGQWIVNSKGSFTSDHVFWAQEILKDKNLDILNKTWTYCFELITPYNRVVVNYKGMKDLVFLRAFHTESGTEVNLFNLKGFTSVESVLAPAFKPHEFKDLNTPNREGFVIQFHNGERCKIKFDDYIKLHSLYTRTSTYDIWNCLKDGEDITKVIEEAPDEIYNWIKDVTEDLESNFNNLLTQIKAEYKTICLSLGQCSDKEFALFVKGNQFEHYMFKLRYNKDIRQQVWKDIKPQYETFTL